MISKNQIKYIQSLHQKKQRELEQCFIVEGIKLVTEFMKHSTFELLEIYATAAFLESSQFEKKYLSTYTICEISDDELKKISLQSTPNAILAIAKQNKLVLNTTYLSTGLNLYLDDIRDPGNLGTIIRIADWFGIKQIICSPTTTELYNPKTIQASMGAVLRVNIVHETFDKIEAQLNTIPIYGAVLNGKSIYTSNLKNGILVIGNEANGISTDILTKITQPITIPAALNNGSESLNAANACAIICSEFFRQRSI